MINAWEYAYENYDGENEDAVVDSIVEQIADEVCDAIEVDDRFSENQRMYDDLCVSIRELVTHNVNFNEIKDQMENDREEYYEHRRSSLGEY